MVKGSKITSKLAFVDSEFGEVTRYRVVTSLSAEDQMVVRSVIEAGWYPQAVYERLLRAICTEAAQGDTAIYARIGRHTAEHQFSRAYRFFQTPDLAGTLQNLRPMHNKLNDPADMSVELDEGAGHCAVIVRQPISSLVICAIARAFYARTVELCGGADSQVDEPQCSGRGDPCCRFELSWRVGDPVPLPVPAADEREEPRRLR